MSGTAGIPAPSGRGGRQISPATTAAHFRKLTPLVLLAALKQAGTVICEPMIRVGMEIPAEAVSSVLAAAARLGGVPERHRRTGT